MLQLLIITFVVAAWKCHNRFGNMRYATGVTYPGCALSLHDHNLRYDSITIVSARKRGKMDARKVAKEMTIDSGLSMYRVSIDMGRNKSFLGTMLASSRSPSAEMLAEIGTITGHDVIVRNRSTGREIIIDPPDKPKE